MASPPPEEHHRIEFEMESEGVIGCTMAQNNSEKNGDIDRSLAANEGSQEPFIGLEFQSTEDAFKYYNEYANCRGFSIRKSRITKSRTNGAMIGREFVCSKEGFRAKKYSKRDDRTHMPPDETREGCKAVLHVSKKEEGRWIVSRFVREHNHELASPHSTKFLRTKRKKSEVHRNIIDILDQSGVRPGRIISVLANEAGGIENVCLTESDVRNYLSSKRQKYLEKGDAQLMLNYFQECQSKNPGFFYAIQMDAEGHLANCFWADARSRMSYKFFGDVVAFDPTYLTNKYKMPFVPFTGVNHHHQSILFGCALLWDETEASFIWLLRTWLEAMYGHPPRTIITDQDAAITNAVAKVLPDTTHHFCMWHIEKKVPEVLSHVYHQNEDVKYQFYKCIHQTTTQDEFELAWMEIIEKYNLETNDWLRRIYAIREKWVPAYLRTTFCAGMSTTQRSESMNKYFKDYVNSSTPMSKFVIQYEKALDSRYDKAKEKNFKTKNSKPVLKTLYPMEEEAAKVYTRKVFRIFQDELIHSQQYISEKIDVTEGVYKYKVHELTKEKPVYIVTLEVSSQKAVCICHKFEFMGILCRHILTVFIKKSIHSLPPHYILDRWTRNATKDKIRGLSSEELQVNTGKPSALWFNSIMVHAIGLSERASRSEKHYDFAIQGLQQLFDGLDALPIENDKTNGSGGLLLKNNFEVDIAKQSQACLQSPNITLLDPPYVATKGRPRALRMKSALEKSQKGSMTCSSCKHKGHTKRTCPHLKKSRCNSNIELAHNSNVVEAPNFINTQESPTLPTSCQKPQNDQFDRAYPTRFMDLMAAASQLPFPQPLHSGSQ